MKSGAKILFVGVLAVWVVMAVATLITALAPYIAAGLVVSGVCWWAVQKEDPPELPKAKPPVPPPRIIIEGRITDI